MGALRGHWKLSSEGMAGADYIPREDVQIIVCANQSPYEFFGKFDPKLQRKMVSPEELSQLEERVYYVRLDGDGTATRRKFMHATSWSDDEFVQEVQAMRDVIVKGRDMDTKREIWLEEACALYKTRERAPVLDDFCALVCFDNEDKIKARQMFTKRMRRPNLFDDSMKIVMPVKCVLDGILKRKNRAFTADERELLTKRLKQALFPDVGSCTDETRQSFP